MRGRLGLRMPEPALQSPHFNTAPVPPPLVSRHRSEVVGGAPPTGGGAQGAPHAPYRGGLGGGAPAALPSGARRSPTDARGRDTRAAPCGGSSKWLLLAS